MPVRAGGGRPDRGSGTGMIAVPVRDRPDPAVRAPVHQLDAGLRGVDAHDDGVDVVGERRPAR
jgi:hypothetical protein